MFFLICRAAPPAGFTPQKENCELSDHDSRDLNLNNPSFFETNGDYDFYERSPGRGLGGDCLDGAIFVVFFALNKIFYTYLLD